MVKSKTNPPLEKTELSRSGHLYSPFRKAVKDRHQDPKNDQSLTPSHSIAETLAEDNDPKTKRNLCDKNIPSSLRLQEEQAWALESDTCVCTQLLLISSDLRDVSGILSLSFLMCTMRNNTYLLRASEKSRNA